MHLHLPTSFDRLKSTTHNPPHAQASCSAGCWSGGERSPRTRSPSAAACLLPGGWHRTSTSSSSRRGGSDTMRAAGGRCVLLRLIGPLDRKGFAMRISIDLIRAQSTRTRRTTTRAAWRPRSPWSATAKSIGRSSRTSRTPGRRRFTGCTSSTHRCVRSIGSIEWIESVARAREAFGGCAYKRRLGGPRTHDTRCTTRPCCPTSSTSAACASRLSSG